MRVEREGGAAAWLTGPGSTKRAGTQAASAPGATAPSESFLEPPAAGVQKASVASLSL